MFTLNINTERVKAGINDRYRRQVPFALSRTINRITFLAQQEVRKQMDRQYQGGATPFTKSAIRYTKASKSSLVGLVYIADGRDYIKTTIDGGRVRPTRRALVQPVQARLNKYGNLSRGYTAKTRASDKFFAGVPRGRPNNQDHEGIYERMGRKGKRGGKGRQTIRMVASFKDGRTQQAFFPAKKIARRIALKHFNSEFTFAMKQAVRTAR